MTLHRHWTRLLAETDCSVSVIPSYKQSSVFLKVKQHAEEGQRYPRDCGQASLHFGKHSQASLPQSPQSSLPKEFRGTETRHLSPAGFPR